MKGKEDIKQKIKVYRSEVWSILELGERNSSYYCDKEVNVEGKTRPISFIEKRILKEPPPHTELIKIFGVIYSGSLYVNHFSISQDGSDPFSRKSRSIKTVSLQVGNLPHEITKLPSGKFPLMFVEDGVEFHDIAQLLASDIVQLENGSKCKLMSGEKIQVQGALGCFVGDSQVQ